MLLMGYLLLGIYFNLSIWFKITDQTKYSFWITLAGAAVTIAVIFLLVPKFGYLGGSLSTILCYLVMCILCFLYGQKYYPIPYQTGRDSFYLIVAFVLSYGGFYLDLGSTVLNFMGKNALLIPFALLLFLLEKEEFKKLRRKTT